MAKLTLILLFISVMAKANPITSSAQPTEDRKSVDVHLLNTQATDVLCDKIELEVTVSANAFDDVIDEVTVAVEPVYIKGANGRVDLNKVGASELLILQTNPKAWITKAHVSVDCHPATFGEYCNFAEKSNDDNYTIQRILNRARKNTCELAEHELDQKLDLSGQNIVSVAPLGYMKRLVKLDLSENKIVDLSPLATLMALEKLYLNRNPLNDIRPILQMPSLKTIQANHTQVYYDPNLAHSVSLGKIELSDTPYAKKISRPKGK